MHWPKKVSDKYSRSKIALSAMLMIIIISITACKKNLNSSQLKTAKVQDICDLTYDVDSLEKIFSYFKTLSPPLLGLDEMDSGLKKIQKDINSKYHHLSRDLIVRLDVGEDGLPAYHLVRDNDTIDRYLNQTRDFMASKEAMPNDPLLKYVNVVSDFNRAKTRQPYLHFEYSHSHLKLKKITDSPTFAAAIDQYKSKGGRFYPFDGQGFQDDTYYMMFYPKRPDAHLQIFKIGRFDRQNGRAIFESQEGVFLYKKLLLEKKPFDIRQDISSDDHFALFLRTKEKSYFLSPPIMVKEARQKYSVERFKNSLDRKKRALTMARINAVTDGSDVVLLVPAVVVISGISTYALLQSP